MRAIFIASFLANVILDLASSVILPDRVAIHFGLGGSPNGWASNLTSTLLMLGTNSLVFISLYFSPRLLTTLPIKWISLPNRDYWLDPEHRLQAMEKFSLFIWRFGTVLLSFLFLTGLLSLMANLSDPVRLDERPLLIALALFVAYTVYWTVSLVRAFNVPPDK